MAAQYAITDRVGCVDAGFQYVPLVKNIKVLKNPVFYRNCIDRIHFPFLAVRLILQ